MNSKQIIKKMEDLTFFNELSKMEKKTLSELEDYLMQYGPAEKILKEGMVDDGFYILLDGRVSVTKNKPPEITVAQLVPGAIFGEITLRGKRPRTSSITADEDVVALKVDGPLINKELDPVLANKIKDQVIELLVRRLDEMNNKLVAFIR